MNLHPEYVAEPIQPRSEAWDADSARVYERLAIAYDLEAKRKWADVGSTQSDSGE